MDAKFIDEIRKVIVDEKNIKINEPLSNHTTYKVGGCADLLVLPSSKEEIKSVIEVAKKNNVDYFLLGRGSNVLASDDGYRGMVIKLSTNFSKIEINDNIIKAEAGAPVVLVSNKAAKAGLTGMEFICGVPGTVGGAVVMNAGCYGSEISNIIKKATILNDNCDIVEFTRDDLHMSYRHTVLEDRDYILLDATFELTKSNIKPEEIKNKMNELNERRSKVQPLEYPNAGSVFKRPEGYYPGQIIEEAGFKGYKIGGAEVSTKHANFIVNDGKAKASDIYSLINEIQTKVKETKNIDLVLEQKFLGKF